MVSFDLKDRIALVTGASRGIGRAIAETLAEQGAEMVLVSRRQESLETVAAGICEKAVRRPVSYATWAASRTWTIFSAGFARHTGGWTSW